MAANRKTDDFYSIKTRALTVQNADGSFPPLAGIFTAGDTYGHLSITNDIDVNSVFIAGTSGTTGGLLSVTEGVLLVNGAPVGPGATGATGATGPSGLDTSNNYIIPGTYNIIIPPTTVAIQYSMSGGGGSGRVGDALFNGGGGGGSGTPLCGLVPIEPTGNSITITLVVGTGGVLDADGEATSITILGNSYTSSGGVRSTGQNGGAGYIGGGGGWGAGGIGLGGVGVSRSGGDSDFSVAGNGGSYVVGPGYTPPTGGPNNIGSGGGNGGGGGGGGVNGGNGGQNGQNGQAGLFGSGGGGGGIGGIGGDGGHGYIYLWYYLSS
jgi:hypothetical protein